MHVTYKLSAASYPYVFAHHRQSRCDTPTRMSPPSLAQSLLTKCSSTLICYIRAAPLWIVVILGLLAGAVRHFLFPSPSPPRQPPAPHPAPALRARAAAAVSKQE
ncbi:uncharacterized protein SPSK_10099 [Sporothrix schenckii 1099-18]|uniref:Uncharacterized protein n=1 Tax=Sporothrix schenckii 1099-18 TaxID=1397361 RepID=A0A0F2MA78_SPOSC|nr:uncharacterized protein SPSK_10099 [Sporothrix schenckii 1099-18]KJR85066.1 hypothetical protein SPSK_10099 [Sporothrix schenckii 1099-18]